MSGAGDEVMEDRMGPGGAERVVVARENQEPKIKIDSEKIQQNYVE